MIFSWNESNKINTSTIDHCRLWIRFSIKRFTNCLKHLLCPPILPVALVVNRVCIHNYVYFMVSLTTHCFRNIILTECFFSSAQNRQALPKPMLTNMAQGGAGSGAPLMSGNDNRDRAVNGARMPPDSLILYHQDQGAAQAAASGIAASAGNIRVCSVEPFSSIKIYCEIENGWLLNCDLLFFEKMYFVYCDLHCRLHRVTLTSQRLCHSKRNHLWMLWWKCLKRLIIDWIIWILRAAWLTCPSITLPHLSRLRPVARDQRPHFLNHITGKTALQGRN